MRLKNNSKDEIELTGSASHEIENTTLPLDKRRWIVLFLFCLLTFSSALAWITYAPSAESFQRYYGLETTYYINFLSTIYMITYPPLLLPCLYISQIFERWENYKYNKLQSAPIPNQGFGFGLRNTLVLASCLHSFGCWLRYFAKENWTINFWGQCIASFCQVFTLGMPPKIASAWFGEKEQNLAVSIGVTSNVLGSAMGFLLTPYAVDPNDLISSIPSYLLGQAIAYTVLALAIIIFFPTAPKFRPSNKEFLEPTALNLLKSIKELMLTPTFNCFSLSYGLLVGGQYTIQTLLSIMILPVFLDISELQVGWLGFYMLIAGIITSLVAGYYLDRFHHHFAVSLVLYILTTISIFAILLSLEYSHYYVLYSSCLLYGMTSAALMPVMFQFGSILYSTYSETTITGLLNSLAQVFGIVLITSMSGLEDRIGSQKGPYFTMRVPLWILSAVGILGLVLLVVGKILERRKAKIDVE